MANAVSRVRIPYSPYSDWSVGQVVKTPPFHGGNTGSNPVRVILIECWRFSSAGRASALQAEGQRFDPVNSHRSRGVAVITSPCHGEDRGFDSRRDRSSRNI